MLTSPYSALQIYMTSWKEPINNARLRNNFSRHDNYFLKILKEQHNAISKIIKYSSFNSSFRSNYK